MPKFNQDMDHNTLVFQKLPSIARRMRISAYFSIIPLLILFPAAVTFYLVFPDQMIYPAGWVRFINMNVQFLEESSSQKGLQILFLPYSFLLLLSFLLTPYQFHAWRQARLIVDQMGIHYISGLPRLLQGLNKFAPKDWSVPWSNISTLQIKLSDYSKVSPGLRYLALKIHTHPQPPEIYPYEWIPLHAEEPKNPLWKDFRTTDFTLDEIKQQILQTPLIHILSNQPAIKAYKISYLIDNDLNSRSYGRAVMLGLLLSLLLVAATILFTNFYHYPVKVVEATPELKAELQAPNIAVQTFRHDHNVLALAFSTDGNWLATGGKDKRILLWDIKKRRQLRELAGHGKPIHALAFSPDNTLLASGSEDNTIRLWDPQTGVLQRTLKSPPAVSSSKYKEVYALAFSVDGTLLASGNWDGGLSLWHIPDGRLLNMWDSKNGGHNDSVNALAFSADGQWLASGAFDSSIKLWQVGQQQLTLQHTLRSDNQYVFTVAFSPDGQYLASGTHDRNITLWDLAHVPANPITTIKAHGDSVTGLSFRKDSQVLASSGRDFRARVWSVKGGTLLSSLDDHGDHVNAVAFSPDGQQLATVSGDNTVKLWQYNPPSLDLAN